MKTSVPIVKSGSFDEVKYTDDGGVSLRDLSHDLQIARHVLTRPV